MSYTEVRELTEEIARLFEDLDRELRQPHRTPAGQCSPALDVVETEGTVEIVLDLPGVNASDIRVLIKKGVVLIAGEKRPPDPEQRAEATFHLVERGFGRFARAVRLTGAFDAGQARAHLGHGELRVTVPKIEERRGSEIRVPVEYTPE